VNGLEPLPAASRGRRAASQSHRCPGTTLRRGREGRRRPGRTGNPTEPTSPLLVL